jgi:DNA-binding Lrp family transcriptional regulator
VIDDYVVHLIKEYLDRYRARNEPVRLATMLHEIDYRNRTIPRFEEVNRALKKCPSMYVHRTNGNIEFAPIEGERKITAEDMQQAYASYREWFDTEYQKLQSRE